MNTAHSLPTGIATTLGGMTLHKVRACDIPTAALVATGLVGGWQVARATGVRPLGGVVLALCGAGAAHGWVSTKGPVTAGALGGLYAAAFGLSHPLAKRIGPWPAVLLVTAVAAGVTYAVADAD